MGFLCTSRVHWRTRYTFLLFLEGTLKNAVHVLGEQIKKLRNAERSWSTIELFEEHNTVFGVPRGHTHGVQFLYLKNVKTALGVQFLYLRNEKNALGVQFLYLINVKTVLRIQILYLKNEKIALGVQF